MAQAIEQRLYCCAEMKSLFHFLHTRFAQVGYQKTENYQFSGTATKLLVSDAELSKRYLK